MRAHERTYQEQARGVLFALESWSLYALIVALGTTAHQVGLRLLLPGFALIVLYPRGLRSVCPGHPQCPVDLVRDLASRVSRSGALGTTPLPPHRLDGVARLSTPGTSPLLVPGA